VARDGDKKKIPPLILVNSEGAVGYHATDIGTILDRVRTVHPDQILYVVDNRQALHFEQVFRAVDKAGYFEEARLEHLGFGTMQGKDGKPFKTREGGVLKLRDMIDSVTQRAATRLTENGLAESLSDEERAGVAMSVGVAALKFADLSNQRTSDYIFDIERFIAFEGKTGPYLQYACVRAKSALAKAAAHASEGPVALSAEEERQLALSLLAFSDAVKGAYEKRLPHLLCEHAYGLAQSFSRFYAACRISDEPDEKIRASRMRLTTVFCRQLACVLDVLGIDVPAKM
ncbi:MAG: arginine--tRNA ligase, partial [Pseudomonadota bacterium]